MLAGNSPVLGAICMLMVNIVNPGGGNLALLVNAIVSKNTKL